ncbi:hypothetical protein YC2023_049030 [Brassica napus]
MIKPRRPEDISSHPGESETFLQCTSIHQIIQNQSRPYVPFLESKAINSQQLFSHQDWHDFYPYFCSKEVPKKLTYSLKPSRYKIRVKSLEESLWIQDIFQRLVLSIERVNQTHGWRESIIFYPSPIPSSIINHQFINHSNPLSFQLDWIKRNNKSAIFTIFHLIFILTDKIDPSSIHLIDQLPSLQHNAKLRLAEEWGGKSNQNCSEAEEWGGKPNQNCSE